MGDRPGKPRTEVALGPSTATGGSEGSEGDEGVKFTRFSMTMNGQWRCLGLREGYAEARQQS
jgi:hypothetical protein